MPSFPRGVAVRASHRLLGTSLKASTLLQRRANHRARANRRSFSAYRSQGHWPLGQCHIGIKLVCELHVNRAEPSWHLTDKGIVHSTDTCLLFTEQSTPFRCFVATSSRRQFLERAARSFDQPRR